MYKIMDYLNSEELGYTSKPNYINYKKETNCFVTATKENACGITFKNKVYNLLGTPGVGVEDIAYVLEVDIVEFLESLPSQLAAIENALCELDKEED